MHDPQMLTVQLAIAAQKMEKVRETSRLWRLQGIDAKGLVPLEVLSIESKSEDVLKRLKEIFCLVERIREERGEIPMSLGDD